MLRSPMKRSSGTGAPGQAREVRVRVKGGYDPAVVRSEAGVPLRLVFHHEEAAACSDQVVFPAFGRSATLPQGEDVAVEVLPEVPGEYEFTCGMGMLRGRLLVSAGLGWPAAPAARNKSNQLQRRRRPMSTTTEPAHAPSMAPAGAGPHSRGGDAAARWEGPRARRLPTRPKVNITGQERLARVLLGAVGVVWSAFLLAGATSAAAAVLEVLLVAAGADLVVTGALGHCPLYAKIGHVPRSLRAGAPPKAES